MCLGNVRLGEHAQVASLRAGKVSRWGGRGCGEQNLGLERSIGVSAVFFALAARARRSFEAREMSPPPNALLLFSFLHLFVYSSYEAELASVIRAMATAS